MSIFDSYVTKYQHLRMERRLGILQVTLHNNAGPTDKAIGAGQFGLWTCLARTRGQ